MWVQIPLLSLKEGASLYWLINHFTWLNWFVDSIRCLPVCSIVQSSCDIADSRSTITFGIPRCTWQHTLEWTKSNRCIYDIYGKKKKQTSAHSWDIVNLLFLITLNMSVHAQTAITCSKLTKETLEKGVKYVQS